MPTKPLTAREQLDAWRAQQLDQHDRPRFALLEALERRSAACDGPARQLLDARLAALLQHYADAVNGVAVGVAAAPVPAGSARSLLADLSQPRPGDGNADDVYPTLPELDAFRRRWDALRSRSQLRQSLAPAPEDGGPLNSTVLVHRAMALMRDASPEYLQHFLAYMDTLSWLEHMHAWGVLGAKKAPAAGSPAAKRRRPPRTTKAG